MTERPTAEALALRRDPDDLLPYTMIVLVLLFAFALGAYGLDLDTISRDELNSLTIMGAFDHVSTPADIVSLLQEHSPHHQPLYFLLGWMWSLFTELSQFSMRLFSLLLGMLSLAMLYRLAADLVDWRAGILASLLLGANVLTIAQFHNIRMYTLVLLLSTMHFWLYWRLVHQGDKGRLRWCLVVASCAALFYTHNFLVVYFAGLGIYHLLFVARSRRWLGMLLAWAIGFVIFLPGLQQTLLGISFQAQFPRVRPLLTDELISAVALELTNHAAVLWPPILFAIGLSLSRNRRGIVARLLFIGIVMFLIMASIDAVTHFLDWTGMRHFISMWPIFVVGISAALFALPWKRISITIFVLVWVAFAYQHSYNDLLPQYSFRFYPNKEKPPLHRYLRHLKGKVREDDYILGFRTSDEIFADWFGRGGSYIDYYLGNQLGIGGTFLHASLKRYRLTEDTRDILAARPHLLLAHDPSNVPLNYARTLEVVQESLRPCEHLVDEPALSIRKFAHPVMDCDHERASIQYENGLRLLDRATRYDAADQRIAVLTWWEVPDDEMLEQYNISLQIIALDWQNLHQVDRHLYDRLVPWGVSELSTADLPPDDYRLVLILYNRESGAKVPGVDELSGESANILPILRFSIDT